MTLLDPWPSILVLVVAVALDLGVGELPTKFHPVVWIGRLIKAMAASMPRSGISALIAGCFLATSVPAIALATSALGLYLLEPWPWLAVPAAALLLTSCFSIRMLGQEASTIAGMLQESRLDEARSRLGHLCSRDAENLAMTDVAGAAVESVAENTSDSVIGPFTFYLLAGLPGAVLFRTVNTLDSMVGYRGEYEQLGKASAKLDDLLCWLPARLNRLVFLGAAVLGPGSARRGWTVGQRDAAKTASPNAGHPMATIAGILGIRLVKRDVYVLGDEGADPSPRSILESVQLMGIASLLALTLCIVWLFPAGPWLQHLL